MKIQLKIVSFIGAILAGGLVAFLTIISGFNFLLMVIFEGNELVVQASTILIFLAVSFFAFKWLNKLLQSKFNPSQNGGAT